MKLALGAHNCDPSTMEADAKECLQSRDCRPI